MIRVGIIVGLLSLLTGCLSSGGSTGAPPAQPTLDANSRCRVWLAAPASERFAASQNMIVALQARDTSDAFAERFARDVSRVCRSSRALKVSEVAAGLATLDRRDFK